MLSPDIVSTLQLATNSVVVVFLHPDYQNCQDKMQTQGMETVLTSPKICPRRLELSLRSQKSLLENKILRQFYLLPHQPSLNCLLQTPYPKETLLYSPPSSVASVRAVILKLNLLSYLPIELISMGTEHWMIWHFVPSINARSTRCHKERQGHITLRKYTKCYTGSQEETPSN